MIQKDGHTDVASSRRMCKTIIEDAEDILEHFQEIWRRLYQPGGRINLQPQQLILIALEII